VGIEPTRDVTPGQPVQGVPVTTPESRRPSLYSTRYDLSREKFVSVTGATALTRIPRKEYGKVMLDSPLPKRPIPFYGSYASFLRAVVALKKHGIPNRLVAKYLVPFMPRDEPSRVVAGFEALGWIDDFGQPTNDLRRIVQAYGDEAEWKAALSEIAPKTYDFLPHNWGQMTGTEMHNAFVTHAGREAGAIKSAETFFLCLAADGGIRISDEFDRRVGRQISDAKRSILLDRLAEEKTEIQGRQTMVLEPIIEIPARADHREGPKVNNPSPWEMWTEQILNLTALLDDHDMTDKERAAVLTLLSSLRRRGQLEKKLMQPDP
jgi:hypothetical protein